MKSFFIIISLFAIMLFGATCNFIYIRNLSDDLIQACQRLDGEQPREQISEQAKQIRTHWERNRKFVQITVSHTEIEAIDHAVDALYVYATLGDKADFTNAKQCTINAFEELRSSETLFPTGVL